MKNNILLLILFLSVAMNAQEKTEFSLREALDFAYENAYAIKSASNEIEKADERAWETISTGLPQINGNVDYQNFLIQPTSLIPAEFVGGTPGEYIPVNFGTQQNINANVTLSQLLFDGSYIVGLESIKTYKKISEAAKVKTEFSIKQAVVSAYVNVILVEERLLILEKNKLVLEKNLEQTTKIVENGFAEEQDAEQLQLTLSAILNEINRTNRYKTTSIKLLNMSMGLEVATPTTLTQNFDDLLLENLDLGLAQTNFDITSHIDYQIAENYKMNQSLLVKYEKSKALPSLRAFVNYGSRADNSEFAFFQDTQKWYDSSLLGVSMTIPIFSSLQRSSKTQQAKLNLQIAERQLTETEQKLKIDIQDARTDYQFAIDNYQYSKDNLDLAERIEKKENIKFFEGVSTSFDLTNAQNQLYSKQQNYLEAMQYLINSKTNLENALNIK
ncbi:MAG: TolC family protein [Flavobacteriaceae bacterium]|nr:TolC family protein [Flavobacteriaceae bacterium]